MLKVISILLFASCTASDTPVGPDAGIDYVCLDVLAECGPPPVNVSPYVEYKDTHVELSKEGYLSLERFKHDALLWALCVQNTAAQ